MKQNFSSITDNAVLLCLKIFFFMVSQLFLKNAKIRFMLQVTNYEYD